MVQVCLQNRLVKNILIFSFWHNGKTALFNCVVFYANKVEQLLLQIEISPDYSI